jgi:hypothetical protein
MTLPLIFLSVYVLLHAALAIRIMLHGRMGPIKDKVIFLILLLGTFCAFSFAVAFAYAFGLEQPLPAVVTAAIGVSFAFGVLQQLFHGTSRTGSCRKTRIEGAGPKDQAGRGPIR